MIRSVFLSLLLLFAATPAAAQVGANGDEELVDRVVAVVADTVLLMSDVREELQRMQAAGQLPNDPVQVELITQTVIESRVNDLIMLAAAADAGLTVPEERVNELVQREIASVEQRFGSAAAFEAALIQSGLTRELYRQTLAHQLRDRQIIQEFMRSRLSRRTPPVVDEREIREFFDEQRETLPQRPATVSFRQVVVSPEPSPEARQAALQEAQEVLGELQTGADFQVLARRFSDDAATAEHGGDLGWFRTGQMVPEFEQVAFAMRAGQTSGIIESPFGFHIIRVERTRGAERQARHILIQPEVTEADIQRARERADSVASAVRGGAPISDLASRYNREEDVPSVDRLPLDRLPPGYIEPLSEAEPGSVVGPFELSDPQATRFVVLQLISRQETGDYTLDDLRDDIRQRIEQEKMVEQLLQELRQQVYHDVRI